MALEFLIEDHRWKSLGLTAIAGKATQITLTHLALEPSTCEISLLACDDARIATLNADFRDNANATNVLSWPANDLAAKAAGAPPYQPRKDAQGIIELGDIAIAYETCANEAALAGKPLQDHVTHLVVHGLLHLLGYDHIRDQDATLMQALEAEILGIMGLDDPY